MTDREQFSTASAGWAQLQNDRENRTRALVIEQCHPPEKARQAPTSPAHFDEWSRCNVDAAEGGPAKQAGLDRPGDHLDGGAVEDLFKHFANLRSLCG